MREHNQTVFYLEQLQPDWLAPAQRRVYIWLANRLPSILIGGLAGLLIAPFFIFVYFTSTAFLLRFGMLGGALGGLFSCLPRRGGVIAGGHHLVERVGLSPGRLALTVFIGVAIGLSFGLDLDNNSYWLRDSFIYGTLVGLGTLLLLFIKPSAYLQNSLAGNDMSQQGKSFGSFIQSVHGQRALLVAIVMGIGSGLSNLLNTWLGGYGLVAGLSFGPSGGFSIALSVGFTCLLVSLMLEVEADDIRLTDRLTWTLRGLARKLFSSRHLRTTLLFAGIITALFGLGSGIDGGLRLASPDQTWLNSALSFGLSDGLSAGLSFGLSYWFTTVALLSLILWRIKCHICNALSI